MASLYIGFCSIGTVRRGGLLHIVDGDTVVSATLTTSASNTQSAASTRSHVRCVSDVAHWIAIGSNPDATTTTTRFYLPANTIEYYEIDEGNKVGAITA